MLKGGIARSRGEVKQAIEELKPHLPAGTTIEPYYDRGRLHRSGAERTVSKNLTEGAVLVVACLLVTLGTLRAGFLVAGAIPSPCSSHHGADGDRLTGNVMSLGASTSASPLRDR